MYQTILVPLDGSPIAERAIPYAATLARLSGARLLLVRATSPVLSRIDDVAHAPIAAVHEVQDYLTAIAGRLAPLNVETAAFYGDAAEAILEAMRQGHADVVVMSTHGHSGVERWVYGSVADRVLRRAEMPVLLIPAGCAAGWTRDHTLPVLVPLDGSALAEEALGPAREVAQLLGAGLVLVRAIEPAQVSALYLGASFDPTPVLAEARRYLDRVADRLRFVGNEVETRSALGPADRVIAAIAQELGASLIAVTAHGSGGGSRLVLGRVATSVVQGACMPVLVVTPRAAREEQPAPGVSTPDVHTPDLPITLALTRREIEILMTSLENTLIAAAYGGQASPEIQDLLARLHHADAALRAPGG